MCPRLRDSVFLPTFAARASFMQPLGDELGIQSIINDPPSPILSLVYGSQSSLDSGLDGVNYRPESRERKRERGTD